MRPIPPNSGLSPHLYQSQRRKMVDLLRRQGVRNQAVLRVMEEIPRHMFVPEALAAKAYGDHALPIGHMQTISQPYMVARMTELLEVGPASTVLEIGAGSGYQTAVLAALGARVFAIERIAELSRSASAAVRQLGLHNATIKSFDGTIGWSEHAPYDGILVAAGGPSIPDPLLSQLRMGGRLVIPIGDQENQILVRITRTEQGIVREDLEPCSFVKLIGRYGWGEQAG